MEQSISSASEKPIPDPEISIANKNQVEIAAKAQQIGQETALQPVENEITVFKSPPPPPPQLAAATVVVPTVKLEEIVSSETPHSTSISSSCFNQYQHARNSTSIDQINTNLHQTTSQTVFVQSISEPQQISNCTSDASVSASASASTLDANQSTSGPSNDQSSLDRIIGKNDSANRSNKTSDGQLKKRKKNFKKGAKLDVKLKLEKSRQSARECRARKKLRYQYLEDLVSNREKAVMILRDELVKFCDIAKQLDSGSSITDSSLRLVEEQAKENTHMDI